LVEDEEEQDEGKLDKWSTFLVEQQQYQQQQKLIDNKKVNSMELKKKTCCRKLARRVKWFVQEREMDRRK
jgi:hypothetical protein